MASKISYAIGFIIILVGFLWLRGPAIEMSDYLYSIATMFIGVFIVWLGNKEIFKKDSDNNEKDKNT